jgi:hypothetical protein
MKPAERAELARRNKDFLLMKVEEQERLRRFANALADDKNKKELERVLAAYTQWLAGRTEGERKKLRELRPDKRVAQIMAWREESLSWDDRKVIFDWLGEYTAEHREVLAKLAPRPPIHLRGEGDRRFRNPSKDEEMEFQAWWVIMLPGIEPGRIAEIPYSAQDFDNLMQRLSDKPRAALSERTSVESKKQLLAIWQRHAFREDNRRRGPGGRGWGNGNSGERERVLMNMSDAEQYDLFMNPPDAVRAQLEMGAQWRRMPPNGLMRGFRDGRGPFGRPGRDDGRGDKRGDDRRPSEEGGGDQPDRTQVPPADTTSDASDTP